MGSEALSIQVRGGDLDKIRTLLNDAALKHDAPFFLVAGKEWTTIFPSAAAFERVGFVDLCKKFAADHALIVSLHDSDVFEYTYLRGKKVVDRLNGAPDYFGESTPEAMAAVGDPDAFLDLVGEKGVAKLRKLLSARLVNGEEVGGEMADEEERVPAFGKILKLPGVLTCFEYIENEGAPAGLKAIERFGKDPGFGIPGMLKVIARVAKEAGYKAKGKLFWKRGKALTTFIGVYKFRYTDSLRLSFGSAPNELLKGGGLPPNEWYPFRMYASDLTDQKFARKLGKLEGDGESVSESEYRALVAGFIAWVDANVADEDAFRASLRKRDAWPAKAHDSEALFAWAKGKFKPSDYPEHQR